MPLVDNFKLQPGFAADIFGAFQQIASLAPPPKEIVARECVFTWFTGR